ncbi:MAG: hypothetical protein WCK34_17405 [Bacteroidota bacterium]
MKINVEEIKGHCQKTQTSCVPMSVECVLKLLKLMSIDDFSLQDDPGKSGTSDWVRGFLYPSSDPKVVFSREFLLKDSGFREDRGAHFMKDYFEPLFETIDKELADGRYVIISLKSGSNTTHNEVIFNKVNDHAYETLSFYHGNPDPVTYPAQDLRQRVTEMEGTDILTYKFL